MATEKQIHYLKHLGYSGSFVLSTEEASKLIDNLIASKKSFPKGSPKVQKVDRSKYKELLQRNNTLLGGVVVGIEGHIIEIQARAVDVLKYPAPPAKSTTITGMLKGAVTESLSRIHGAFTKLGIPDSHVEVLINLAPANTPKEGTWLDLPIAIIILQASGILPDFDDAIEKDYIFMGEIGIHGELRRVPGALSIAYAATSGQKIIVPKSNEKECALVKLRSDEEDLKVYSAETLQEVIQFFEGKQSLNSATKGGVQFEPAIPQAVDFGAIRGQEKAKRAALISSAGGHNLLMIGPPGEGKSLIASAIPGILPPLENHEKADLTRIYSACGKLEHDAMAVTRRPMRSVHCTASKQAMIGGGSKIPSPGEITLAHLGILFLDELPEFSRDAIESLRQPMESGIVTISRSEASLDFPARFTLVVAMNPCPCGHYGSDRCTCRESDVFKYQSKISGPILDRIDLQVQISALSFEEKFAPSQQEQTPRLKAIVKRARDRQAARFQNPAIPHNAAMPGGRVQELCFFSDAGFQFYKEVVSNNSLSTRSVDRLAKVSRTIADIENVDYIEPCHIDEAASFVIGGPLRDIMK